MKLKIEKRYGKIVFTKTEEGAGAGKPERIELTVAEVESLVQIIQAAVRADSFVFEYQKG